MAKQPKQNRPVDLRTKSAEQLEQQVLDLRREQFNLRFQRATGQTEGIGRVRTVRRDIARIKTILGEKQRLSPAKI